MKEIEQKYDELRSRTFHQLLTLLESGAYQSPIGKDILPLLASEMGIEPQYYTILFPGGLKEIMLGLSRDLDQKMLATLKKSPVQEKTSIRAQIKLALETRIIDSVNFQAQKRIIEYFMKAKKTALIL